MKSCPSGITEPYRAAHETGKLLNLRSLPSLPELPVQPLVFLLHMGDPERLPLPIEVRRTQVEHRLGSIGNPTHPSSLQPVLHQVPTPPLDHAAADRVARRKELVVPHPGAVPVEVADDFPHRLAA